MRSRRLSSVSYGTVARANQPAAGGDTIFEIGSITKLFTSLFRIIAAA
jgi:CubicO group peptidase (beta-lactamase class C family)